MTDIIDRATACASIQLESAIEAARMKKHHGKSKGFCCDCCSLIPNARLRVFPDAVRCVDCQNIFEQKEKGE